MFDHVSLRVSDLPFAVGALGAGLRELGIEQTADTPSFAMWGNFVLMQDNDDRPPTRRVHVAFIAKAQADVDRFWQAGVDAGLVDDGPAGPRPHYADDYYAGFLKDAAGNGFEAVYRDGDRPRGNIDDADEVEGVQGIDEKQLERVCADLSEYGQVGVGWADPGKERAEPLTLRPR